MSDILQCRLGEFARSGAIEFEADDRLTRALVETRLRIGQVAAGDEHLLLDDVGDLRRGRTHQHLGVGRYPARLRLIRRHRAVDHAEFHLGGLAQDVLELGRILQARHLHQDAVGALPLDQRLHSAEFVDATLDDLDRLFDGLADAVGDGGLRNSQPDQPAAGVADFERALAAGADQSAQRLRQLAQLAERVLQVGILDADLNAVGPRRKPGVSDLGVAQRAAHIIADLIELLFLDVVGINLEQQIRAALQVEAEHQASLRPCRPGLDFGFGEEVRDGAKAHHQRRQNDAERLPPRKIQHRIDPSQSGAE